MAAAAAVVAALWFANQALGPAEDYDLGLYHLNLIDYAEAYRVIPGLANLHVRLATGDTHLLLAALLDRGPIPGTGIHLADGLLAALLIVELVVRIGRRSPSRDHTFTRRMAVLLLPAMFLVAEIRPTHRISSPNLDFAAFVLVAVGVLYLSEWVESRSATAAVAATGTLALVSTSRPLYWLPTLLALGIVLGEAVRSRGRAAARLWRPCALVVVLPALLSLGWMARQAILSGYPLYPSTIVRLPVDWRAPLSVVAEQNRVDFAWARWAGADPNTVLASWHWLTAWWLPRQEWELDVVFPLSLLACVVASATRWRAPDPARRRRARPLAAALAVTLPTLVLWFFVAPDPRFAWGPIWLVPIALAAWALPTVPNAPAQRTLAVAAAVALAGGGALAAVGITDINRLLPAALAGWAAASVGALALRHPQAKLVAHAAAVSVLIAAVAILADRGNLHLVGAGGSGPLGTTPLAPPTLVAVRTSGGLDLVQPTNGGDQCWQVLLCVPDPAPIDPYLHLRGAGIGSGFSVRPQVRAA